MLRINLLPIRQLKKRAKARNQILVFVTLLLFFLLILGAVSFLQATSISNVEEKITQLEREKKQFDPILKKMKELEKAKSDLENKIGVIKKLKKDSSITVHVLDEVAKRVDSKRMWLKSLKQHGSSLSLTGVALDNKTVADFMDALKESSYIANVNLSNASLVKVSGRNLKSFSLACSVDSPKKETQKTIQ